MCSHLRLFKELARIGELASGNDNVTCIQTRYNHRCYVAFALVSCSYEAYRLQTDLKSSTTCRNHIHQHRHEKKNTSSCVLVSHFWMITALECA